LMQGNELPGGTSFSLYFPFWWFYSPYLQTVPLTNRFVWFKGSCRSLGKFSEKTIKAKQTQF
jgi:hypothetical protein